MKPKSIKFPCACVGGKLCGVLKVSDFNNGDYQFDIWVDKKVIGGVVLDKEAIKKLIKFLIVK